jgi:hypothetical protein
MRRQRSKTHPAASLPRESAKKKPLRRDPYETKAKLPDPSACPTCHAIYRAGRWAWGAPPADAKPVACPACRRIADDYPAGIVRLSGPYFEAHREELLHIARNVEERERAEHPLKRIMSIRPDEGVLEVRTTDAKLARGIGEALHHAHKGQLDYTFTERENAVRVEWSR